MKKPTESFHLPLLAAVVLMGCVACGSSSGDPDDGGLPGGGTCDLFTRDVTLTDKNEHGTDYSFDCLAEVAGALTIEPGVSITFGPEGGLNVTTGSISARGTPEKPITFGGTTGGRGTWQGVTVSSDSEKNVFENVGFEHGGGNERANLVVAAGARVSLKDSILINSKAHGVFVEDGANLTFENNTMRNNDKEPVSLSMSQIPILDGASRLTDNRLDSVLVRDGEVGFGDVTWRKLSVPYFFKAASGTEFRIDGAAKVTLEAGADLMFDKDVGLYVGATASLKAVGTEDQPVRFRGYRREAGYWKGLRFASGSVDNVLDHIEVSNAGGSAFDSSSTKASILVEGGVSLTNSRIDGSGECAVRVPDAGGELVESDNTFSGATTDICLPPT